MPKFFTRYKMDERAVCEADSVKALGLTTNCNIRTWYAVKSPKGTQDYALCMGHRDQLKEKGLL